MAWNVAVRRLGGKEIGQLRGGLGFPTVSEAIQHSWRKIGNGSCMIIEDFPSEKLWRWQLAAVGSMQPCFLADLHI